MQNIIAWDAFLKDFEAKSLELINEMSKTHHQQLLSLKQSNTESASTTQAKWSKELIGHRKRQSLMSDQQRYEEAHQTKIISDALEEKERSDHNSITNTAILKREANLTQKHQTEMSVLLKRIEIKRRELQKQRDDEIARLIQRNKNIQASFDSKHVSGCTFCRIPLTISTSHTISLQLSPILFPYCRWQNV
jgi:glycerol-3-phosphate cytidylyltransferase-like family protein